MKSFLQQQCRPGEKMNLTFEISGQAGYMYDSLLNLIDGITVKGAQRSLKTLPIFELFIKHHCYRVYGMGFFSNWQITTLLVAGL